MDLRESSLGFYRVWFAALGQRHGLLEALAQQSRTPTQLARGRGVDAGAVAKWCRGAEALGLLGRAPRGAYRLRAEHRKTLGDPFSVDALGHHFEYLAQKSLSFGDLADLLRGIVHRRDQAPTYAIATRWDHAAFFETFLPREKNLRAKLARGIDVLDMGCGDGGWTIMAARRYPRSRFSASEPDAKALRRARAAFRAEGLNARVTRRPPDAAFDLVFLGEVLTSPAGALDILRAARAALRPGGRLVALEGLLPPPTRRPRGWGEKLVLAMDFDFGLDGSAFLPKEEALRALREAGFRRARARDLGGSLFALQGDLAQ